MGDTAAQHWLDFIFVSIVFIPITEKERLSKYIVI